MGLGSVASVERRRARERARGLSFARRIYGLALAGAFAMSLVGASPALAATNWSTPTQVDSTTAIVPGFPFSPEPKPFEEVPSGLTRVSCASSSFCVAVDSGGNAFIYNGSTWSAPEMIAPGSVACGTKTCSEYLDSVSCPSSSFCVAVSTEGNAFMYDGSSWSAPEAIDPEGSPQSVSCASAMFCAVVDGNDNALTYNGTSWTAPKRIDGEGNAFQFLSSVSCPSASFCATVDSGGHVLDYNGTSWSAPVEVDSSEIVGISCVSSSFCVAVDPNRNALILNGTTVVRTSPLDTPSDFGLDPLSCATESFCVVGDDEGNVLHYDGSSWSGPESLGGGGSVASVSCPSASFCAAVERPGLASIYSPAPPPPPVEKAEYKNWVLAGSIKDKPLGETISLPKGSTFNGTGEVNTETGVGSVKGALSVPPFSTPVKLFGLLPVTFGMTLTQVGPLEGLVSGTETSMSEPLLTLPAKLDLGVTSVSLFGLKIPTSCATERPLSLKLTDALTHQELLHEGWHFSGTVGLPQFTCEGGFLPKLFALVLTLTLSGPENSYAISVTAPPET